MSLHYSEGRIEDWEENGWGSRDKGKLGEPRVTLGMDELQDYVNALIDNIDEENQNV